MGTYISFHLPKTVPKTAEQLVLQYQQGFQLGLSRHPLPSAHLAKFPWPPRVGKLFSGSHISTTGPGLRPLFGLELYVNHSSTKGQTCPHVALADADRKEFCQSAKLRTVAPECLGSKSKTRPGMWVWELSPRTSAGECAHCYPEQRRGPISSANSVGSVTGEMLCSLPP
jgi:hypothetical protein